MSPTRAPLRILSNIDHLEGLDGVSTFFGKPIMNLHKVSTAMRQTVCQDRVEFLGKISRESITRQHRLGRRYGTLCRTIRGRPDILHRGQGHRTDQGQTDPRFARMTRSQPISEDRVSRRHRPLKSSKANIAICGTRWPSACTCSSTVQSASRSA